MSKENQMSRREWFRLRPRQTDSHKRDSERSRSMGTETAGLQPVEHPVNHDGMDLTQLPPMREALLSEENVIQLFADISTLGSNILLMQRSSRSPRATASKAKTIEQLHAALESLVAGSVPRVQIRYRWQAADWIDTLERRDDGIRLVRIAHR